MTSVQKGSIFVFATFLWSSGIWLAWQGRELAPEEHYAEWLSARKGPAAIGRFEVWANRLGIRYFTNARLRSNRKLTLTLLASEDYAIAVASWSDSMSGMVPGTLATWPWIEKSLFEQMKKSESAGLFEALSRADDAGFAKWELTLARSAYSSGAMNDLPRVLEELREFEVRHGSDAEHSDSLLRISDLYAESPADLGRTLAGATDKTVVLLLPMVMADRGVSREEAYEALLADWKKKGFPEADWEIPGKVSRNAHPGRSMTQFLDWLALRRESEVWRATHRDKIGDMLDEFRRSEPAYAREIASHLVREISKKSAELGSDWGLVTGILLSKVDPEPDLRTWIEDDVGTKFAWLCHRMNAEELLNRSVRTWTDEIDDKSRWIAPFVRAGHYAAACALIEGAGEQGIYLTNPKKLNSNERADTLDDYLAVADRIGEHASHPQTAGFVRLQLGKRAMHGLNTYEEKNAARVEVLKAVDLLNRSASPNPGLLEQTVWDTMVEGQEVFEAGRPCFERWRGGVTPDEIFVKVARGEWEPRDRERKIWEMYFKEFVVLSELPSIKKWVAGLVESALDDENAKQSIDHLEDFLGTRGEHLKTGGLSVVLWVQTKMFVANQWEEASTWMFDCLDEYFANSPEAEQSRVMLWIYDTVNQEFSKRTVPDFLRWLGAVMNEPRAGTYLWPRSFPQNNYESKPDGREVILSLEESFRHHPLRRWIVRSLLSKHSSEIDYRKSEHGRFIESAEEMWLTNVINEHHDDTFDPQAFERDMASASPGARRYLLENPPISKSARTHQNHPAGRKLSEDELFQLLLWESDQILEIAERKEHFYSHEFLRPFSELVNKAETHPGEPQIQSVMQRLRRLTPSEEFLHDDLEKLEQLQARALPLSN